MARFDLAHAGRALEGGGSHLAPVPLLRERGSVRVELPEAAR